MKPFIYLDYDDTLVDFNAAVLARVNKEHGTNLTHRDIEYYGFLPDTYGPGVRKLWQSHGLYADVRPFSTSELFLKILSEKYRIRIITKSHPHVQVEKEYHAKMYFGIRDDMFIHIDEDKFPYTTDGVLVDDAAHHIEKHILENNQPGILFNMDSQNGWSKPTIQHRLLRIANSHQAVLRMLGL